MCYDSFFVQFKEIAKVYEVLGDPEKRKLYDRGGEEALKESDGGGGGGEWVCLLWAWLPCVFLCSYGPL